MNRKKITAAVLAAVVIASAALGASASYTRAGSKIWADDGSLNCGPAVSCYSDLDCSKPVPKPGEIWWFAPAADNSCKPVSPCEPSVPVSPDNSCEDESCEPEKPSLPCEGEECSTDNPGQGGSEDKPEIPSQTASELEVKMVALVNAEREAQGMKPLKINDELTNVAREKIERYDSKELL